ncbi:unnamed protein product [Mytilus coruscus]|uniref:Reverse transcriptase domain-containing protein n=1 Tax=Mytilus coruscus TaxID=42192 RepID=A0A6J8A3Y7_MYTCO|nr:unnamed protein product [Mytilus coruscus]
MDGHFKQPPEMDFSHEDNLSEKWKRWKQTMNLYLEVAMGEKTEKEQCRAVLYVIGLEGREIYNTFNFGENEADKLEVLLKKLRTIASRRKCYSNQTSFQHTHLKLIAKNCEFEHLKDGLIRDRIVCGTNSSRVKERLLREDGLTLDKAVGICRADEESRKQMKTLNEEEQVHALRRKTQNQRTNRNEGYAKKGPSRRDHEKRESNSNEYSSCESDGENYFVGAVNRKTEIKENACSSSFKLQDSSVNPVINPPRKIPAALREKLKGTLKEMEDKEVIRKVDEPTDWVNSLVVVEKPKTGKLRICLDPRNLNKAIKREHFALPTIEDITTRLTGAKYMSKLDCNNGYWQLRMDKESQLLTTFNPPREVLLLANAFWN